MNRRIDFIDLFINDLVIKGILKWVITFEGHKVGVFKKHVIVKVREGTVKGSVKLFIAFSKSTYS